MKITAIQPYNLSFSSNCKFEEFEDDYEKRHFADDWGGSKVRDAIRAHFYSQFLPDCYYNGYTVVPGYAQSLDDVYIPNLRKIGHFSYRGSSLAKNIGYLDLLHNSQINTVIDLAGFDDLRQECEKRNIEYFRYDIKPDYWTNAIFYDKDELIERKKNELQEKNLNEKDYKRAINGYEWRLLEERRQFMDDFIKLAAVISHGHFYIACEHGEYRTSNILALNSFFNPLSHVDKTLPTTKFILQSMKNMYKNLSDEEKSRLGFNDKFEKDLKEQLEIC